MDQKAYEPNDLLSKFVDSVDKVMADIKEAEKIAKDLKQTDRTLLHHYNRIITKWFYSNGGI